jgi:secondary thiamine-phosphate synthase enzyme
MEQPVDRIRISTAGRKQVVDLTDRVNAAIRKAGLTEGLCALFLTHTTAALTTGEIGEGTEEDLLEVVEKMIPRITFQHTHNPSHAWSHMASSVIGPSLTIPVSNGALVLGTWQSVLLVELDGPKQRDIHVRLTASL